MSESAVAEPPEGEPAEPTPETHDYNDINTGRLATISIFSILVVVAIIIGTQALYYAYDATLTEKKEFAIDAESYESDRLQQEASLAGYRWVDREAGTVAIPIDRAMDLIVEERRASE